MGSLAEGAFDIQDTDGYSYHISYDVQPGVTYPPTVDTVDAAPGKAALYWLDGGTFSYANTTDGHAAPSSEVRNVRIVGFYAYDRPSCQADSAGVDMKIRQLKGRYCTVSMGEMYRGPDPAIKLAPGESGSYDLSAVHRMDEVVESQARAIAADVQKGPDYVGVFLPVKGTFSCAANLEPLVWVKSVGTPECN